ncbi:AtzH-like domain-containing protein [Nocardioides ultimimeridianus]
MTDDPPAGLLEAFWSYETALLADDVEALDRLFAPGPDTLRGDADGLLVGHGAIAAFRRTRGGTPARTIVDTHVQAVDQDHALVVAVTELARGGRGQQTQLWQRTPAGWRVTAAHVSVPAPALDTRIWRAVGAPLVTGAPDGPLSGEGVAVKDLFAVAGHRLGAGNPAYLSAAEPQTAHADAVAALLDAGASVTGIARTDEFAYSLAGTNAHHGTPPNPRAPYRISGGSSSGSASAVSLGMASIGLGTDTGGSIRVPAAYQGLFGIRTTHGAVSRGGLLPLAPRFDTVGWLTRTVELLARVGDVLLPPGRSDTPGRLVVVPALLSYAEPEVVDALLRWLPDATTEGWEPDLAGWRTAMQTLQAWEAWQSHGSWIEGRWDTLGADVRGRFEVASSVTPEERDRASGVVEAARAAVLAFLGDRILVVPSTSSPAPPLGADPAVLQTTRDATMALTCIAGIGGLPAVNLPLTTASGLPCGVSLLAAPGRDRDLLAMAMSL